MNMEDLVGIIGLKEVEIIMLRQQIAALQKRVKELEPKPEKPADSLP